LNFCTFCCGDNFFLKWASSLCETCRILSAFSPGHGQWRSQRGGGTQGARAPTETPSKFLDNLAIAITRKMKNSIVVKTTTTHKDPIRSDCIYRIGNVPKKVFGDRAPPRPAGGDHSTPRLPAEFMGGRGNGEGSSAGRIKERWEDGDRTEGMGGREGNEKIGEALCPTRN